MDPRTPRSRRFPGESAPTATQARPEAPPLDLAVVEWLERMAPEVRSLGNDGHGEIMYLLGRRELACRVRAEYDRQQEGT
jgi:hypothetical protein